MEKATEEELLAMGLEPPEESSGDWKPPTKEAIMVAYNKATKPEHDLNERGKRRSCSTDKPDLDELERDMSKTDTSTEVKKFAKMLRRPCVHDRCPICTEEANKAATTLESLAAERDLWKESTTYNRGDAGSLRENVERLEQEVTSLEAVIAHDEDRITELRAEVERLREVNQDLSSKEQTRVLKGMIRTATE